jgi:uncharacterized delta-60 repeat protein
MKLTRWLRPLAARLGYRRTHDRRPAPRPAFRPRVEGLEDRTTPSTGGLLDPTFGSGGVVTSSFTNYIDRAFAVTVQPDGKTVIVGDSTVSNSRTGQDFLVARYNPDGSLDTSFGSGGRTVTDFNKLTDHGQAVALQPQATGPAKILVGGIAETKVRSGVSSDFGLVRYNASGTLDTTFGNSGKVMTDFGGKDYGRSMTVQPDGKIILLGQINAPGSFVLGLARYNANGTLDTTFGSGGKLVTSLPSTDSDTKVALQPQPDGTVKIVAAVGNIGPDGFERFVVARFNPNGTADTGFGSGGQVVLTPVPGTYHDLGGLAVQGDGKIVVAGDTEQSGNSFVAVRLTANGSLDTGFGSAGSGMIVVPPPAGYPVASTTDGGGVAIQADGQILIGAKVYDPATVSSLAVLRVNGDHSPNGPAGTVDTGYGVGGYAITRVEYTDEPFGGIAVGPDGKVVAAGSAVRAYPSSTPTDIAMVRFLASAPQVGSFTAAQNTDGTTTLTASNITDGNPNATLTAVEFYYFDDAGNKVSLGTGVANPDGTWAMTVSLPPGSYTLYAQATDDYGASGDPASLSVQMV